MARYFDFIVVGAGVVGLRVAIELKTQFPHRTVVVIDKEDVVGFHSSGRNSGVIHAGFYYTADSLKARFTREGNSFFREYCAQKKVRINNCGKLVVAKSETDLSQFKILLERAKQNKVHLDDISLKEAKELEPRVQSIDRALWSPSTSVVAPAEVMQSFLEEARSLNVEVMFSCAFISRRSDFEILTSGGVIEFGYLINSAGLYADKIAKNFGFAENFRILPFKGLYLYARETAPPLRRHIYPVPNLKNPFLGVHHTVTVDGSHKIGPTAIPALWREQYSGLSRFNFSEFIQILSDEVALMIYAKFGFRDLAFEEISKYFRRKLVNEAKSMATDVTQDDYVHWGRPGIRAQLFNVQEKTLVMDFCFEGDSRSFHILNAISPAFTCAKPFAEFLIGKILESNPERIT